MKYYELRDRKTNEEFIAYGRNLMEACKNANHKVRNVHVVHCAPIQKTCAK